MLHNVKQKIRFKRTTLITVGLFAFLIGLGMARVSPGFSYGWVVVFCLFVIFSGRRRSVLTLGAVILLGQAVGMWRGAIFLNQLEPYRQLTGRQVDFIAKVQSDAVYNDQRQLSFDVDDAHFTSPT